ncbi:hypothetical protein GUITHDRAFT_100037 [Guillardia theta CCMP2712]|uniref:Spt20-like SEP domain-containing protein n=1 Tax=Guillardia theta (strain CCMP2712) TaxID=905079 RepID=L1K2F9_GUITC|nr:hypothetical protein GUITHDRAFT_100037 [Guillardia theta CCMP2712]EKX54563.1 hypothetical protein GUITHDRAFT_100037 [Guillardia theta CCMP2712]|eukprot:XP_005841543.1 hypothetical protein GUITHDRAFT_100037 [Guillardia theta CCMP2712]
MEVRSMMQDVEMQDVENTMQATNGGHNVAKTGTIQITPFRIMAREDIVTAKRSRKRARSPITVDDNLLDYNGPKTLKDLMIEARMRALDGLEVNANRQLTDEPVRQKERRDVIAPGLHAVDRLKSLPVSFTINLFPGGFSIDGMTEAHPYDQHSRDFLKCLDLGRLPGDMIMDRCGDFEFQYFDGCLIVEIKDHRMPKQYDLKPHVHRVVLQPSNQSVANDLKVIWHRNQGLSLDDILQLEQNMLMGSEKSSASSLEACNAFIAQVWHPRNARPEFSKFRRTFDFEAMRKMHNTIYNWNRDPNATQKLGNLLLIREKLAKTRAMRVSGIRGFLQQQHEWEEAEKNEATAGVSAILKLFSSNGGQQQSGASGTLGSPPPLATPKMGLNSPGPMNRALLVRESMVPGAPAERQMRFKKDLQVSSIWLQAKAPSSYYVYMRMEDVTKEGKIVEGSQAQLPASYIGNSQSARRFGSQQYDIMVREGWQPLSDSHIGKKREANSPSSSSIPPPSTAATVKFLHPVPFLSLHNHQGQNGSTSAPPSQVLSTNPSPPAQHAKVIGSSPTPSAHPAASYPPGVPVRPMTAANSRPAGKAGVQPHTLPGGVSSMYTGATQARPYTAPGGQRNIPTSAVPHVQPGHAYQSGVVRPAGTPVSSAAAAAAAAASMMHRPGAGVVGGVGSYAGMACQPPQMKQSGMPGPKDPPKK